MKVAKATVPEKNVTLFSDTFEVFAVGLIISEIIRIIRLTVSFSKNSQNLKQNRNQKPFLKKNEVKTKQFPFTPFTAVNR